jgi:hypothetical protein
MDVYLPEQYRNRGQLLSEYGGGTVSVWDLDANSWRSFAADSVKSLTIENSNHKNQLLF